MAPALSLEALQRDCLRTLFEAPGPGVKDALGLLCHGEGGRLFLSCRAFPGLQGNKVVGFGLDEPVTADQVMSAARWLSACPPGGLLMFHPSGHSERLGGWAAGAGLVRSQTGVTVFRLTEGGAVHGRRPVDVAVEPVRPDEAPRFGEVIAAGLGRPPRFAAWPAAVVGRPGVTAYLAFIGGVAVGGAALYVDGSSGWLFMAAVLPAFRRRGAQGALLARRVEDGRRAGVRTFGVDAISPRRGPAEASASYRNIERAGFEVAYRRLTYGPGRGA